MPRVAAREIQLKFGSCDPFYIAERMGIHVVYCASPTCKGTFYLFANNESWVFMSRDYNETEKSRAVAKAICHTHMHRERAELTQQDDQEAEVFADCLLTSHPYAV